MELSIFLARIFALVYITVGVGMFLNPKYYQKMIDSVMKEHGLLYFGGVFALVFGFILVSSHNIWEKNWTVLITIIGWIALLKGFLLLLFPTVMTTLTKKWLKGKNAWPI